MNPEILQAKVLGQVLDQINKSSNSLNTAGGVYDSPSAFFSLFPTMINPMQNVSNTFRDWFDGRDWDQEDADRELSESRGEVV